MHVTVYTVSLYDSVTFMKGDFKMPCSLATSPYASCRLPTLPYTDRPHRAYKTRQGQRGDVANAAYLLSRLERAGLRPGAAKRPSDRGVALRHRRTDLKQLFTLSVIRSRLSRGFAAWGLDSVGLFDPLSVISQCRVALDCCKRHSKRAWLFHCAVFLLLLLSSATCFGL